LAAGDEVMLRKKRLGDFFPERGSRQKPRLLAAGDEVMSEKSASATFFQ
jgi:hypothetical protein